MSQKVQEPVSVTLFFDHKKKKSTPITLLWGTNKYLIKKYGLHHTYKQGNTTFHVFSVGTDTATFRLVLNGTNLNWVLEEVYDPNFK